MPSITVTICNKLGLHARAAAKLTRMADRFAADIQIEKDGQCINAKSIMQVMMLAAGCGSEVTILAEGKDADAALKDLSELIHNRFDEPE